MGQWGRFCFSCPRFCLSFYVTFSVIESMFLSLELSCDFCLTGQCRWHSSYVLTWKPSSCTEFPPENFVATEVGNHGGCVWGQAADSPLWYAPAVVSPRRYSFPQYCKALKQPWPEYRSVKIQMDEERRDTLYHLCCIVTIEWWNICSI